MLNQGMYVGLVNSIQKRLDDYDRDAFALIKRAESEPLMLCTRGFEYPVCVARIALMGQNREEFINGNSLPDSHQLLLDKYGGDPSKARLAYTDYQSIIAVSDDDFPVTGFVFAVATPDDTTSIRSSMIHPSCIAINAVFNISEKQPWQRSSILSSTSLEEINHWILQYDLLEGGMFHV